MAGTVPNTTTATSHAISIQVNGDIIGMIQTWGPTMSRTITAVYELNPATKGAPIENVPGNLTGLSIQVSRYDLFETRMEQAWGSGYDVKDMLSNQMDPIKVQEVWKYPNGTTKGTEYTGCWFASLGRQISVQGDRLINVSATLMYVKKASMTL